MSFKHVILTIMSAHTNNSLTKDTNFCMAYQVVLSSINLVNLLVPLPGFQK